MIPYIYFALKTNNDVAVEVCVDDIVLFRLSQGAGIDALKRIFPDKKFLIRQVRFSGKSIPNTIRFVEKPDLSADYIYIGDVDILLLDDDITNQHLANMERTGLPYSNIRRKGTDRLTGLHFSKFEYYYPIPEISDLDLARMNDEAVLLQLVSRKKLPLPSQELEFRPVHGIHASPNRQAQSIAGSPHWGATVHFLSIFQSLRNERSFGLVEPYLDKRFLSVVDCLVGLGRARKQDAGEIEAAFSDIFTHNRWQSSKSISGSGSSWEATKLMRPRLKKALADLDIKVLVDAPCGDANWISSLFGTLETYIGIDVVPELIAKNVVKSSERNVFYKLGDITRDAIPSCDAILCRDCLVHLPYGLIMDALFRFGASDTKYVIATTFPGVENKSTDRPGPWRPLDLTQDPFNLPSPIRLINERDTLSGQPNSNKSLGIWRASQIRSAVGFV